MNDFTKEELRIMWDRCYGEEPSFLNKIQSLIDNYCELEIIE